MGKRDSSATRGRVSVTKAAAPKPAELAEPLVHLTKWSVQELQRWMQHNKIPASLPPSTDAKMVTRWNLKRWTELCGGDERAGLRGFNGLRLEMDRVADEEKRRRKQLMIGR